MAKYPRYLYSAGLIELPAAPNWQMSYLQVMMTLVTYITMTGQDLLMMLGKSILSTNSNFHSQHK